MARERHARREVREVADDAVVSDPRPRMDDHELADLRTDGNNRLLGDERTVLELGRGRHLRRRIYERREVVSPQARVQLAADGIVTDRDEDGGARVVPGRLLHRSEHRIALEVAGRLRGVVVGKADHVPERLLRRVVRDYETRGASVQRTLSMWDSVRRGEHRWIFPYQENADVIFNSSTLYELAVLKKHIFPLLTAVEPEDGCYDQVRNIVKVLNFIQEADVDDEIPPTSLVREFIGGNTFYRK